MSCGRRWEAFWGGASKKELFGVDNGLTTVFADGAVPTAE